ncbi:MULTISPECIES: hypothetical protein [Methanobacterium]|uniref:Uncharacterized protein n=1 Tax=Methanobacterium veterum TaxID=408577 RepID=A0A9E4ZV99_9EURY|nr:MULTISPECIES: hypothetical protein [Methanobacterium]MCZ3366277.1 hypothetical protein [Methanobacterium veterum]MCZ3371785.1 hypothetical protein [Methanobacterium veterum]
MLTRSQGDREDADYGLFLELEKEEALIIIKGAKQLKAPLLTNIGNMIFLEAAAGLIILTCLETLTIHFQKKTATS